MQQILRNRLTRLASLPVTITAILAFYSFTPSYSVIPRSHFADFAIGGAAAGINAASYTTINTASYTARKVSTINISFAESKRYLYDSLQLESIGLSRKVFELALHGMEKLKKTKQIQSDILSIADFSKPSIDKRLFVIDLENDQLLFYTWVAHGRNSGTEWANSFSNKPRSKKSSLGFYVTGHPYQGSNGYSLKLIGLEKGFNNNAMQRAIVLHGADYVNTDYISSQGYIGRSQGCPAVTTEISEPLINTIKEGTCLFIYHPSTLYLKSSTLLR
jgi:hypothetical protein